MDALLLLVVIDGGLLIACVICVVAVLGCVIAGLLLIVLSRVVRATGAAGIGVRSRVAEPGRSALTHQSGSVNHALGKAAGRWRGMVGIGVSGVEGRIAEWVPVFVAPVTRVVEAKVAVGVRGRVGLVSMLVVRRGCIRRFGRVVGLSTESPGKQDNDKKAKPFHNSFPTLQP